MGATACSIDPAFSPALIKIKAPQILKTVQIGAATE
jgi:hypothetical protein